MAADTYSSDGVGVLLMGTGNDNNSWGGNCNNNVFQIVADALTNTLSNAVTGGTLDLSGSPPPTTSSQVRYAGLIFTGVLLSNQLIQVPNLNKWWLVKNATSGAFTLKFKTSGGSASTAIPQNSGWQLVRCDGSNVIEVWPFNTATIQMPDGTVSAPAYSNLTEPTSGWYRAGTQDWRLSINGVAVLQCTGTGAGSPSIINVLSPNALQVNGGAVASQNSVFKAADGAVGAPGFTFNSETTSGLYRIGASDVGFAIAGAKVGEWTAAGYAVTGTLSSTGNFAVATNKFTVAASSGNTVVAGTLGVTGAASFTADVAVNTNKFTVAAASGNTATAGSVLSSSASGGIGYSTGAGATVTQLTNKTTGVTINAICGQITMSNAALGAGSFASFTVTNSSVAPGDVVILNHQLTGSAGGYTLNARTGSGSMAIDIRNNTSGSLSEAIVIAFAIIKGSAS